MWTQKTTFSLNFQIRFGKEQAIHRKDSIEKEESAQDKYVELAERKNLKN
jgi:hypothetical protein